MGSKNSTAPPGDAATLGLITHVGDTCERQPSTSHADAAEVIAVTALVLDPFMPSTEAFRATNASIYELHFSALPGPHRSRVARDLQRHR